VLEQIDGTYETANGQVGHFGHKHVDIAAWRVVPVNALSKKGCAYAGGTLAPWQEAQSFGVGL
jgi:hypothetical protein